MRNQAKNQPTKARGGTRGPYGATRLDANRGLNPVNCLVSTIKNQPFGLVFWLKLNRGSGNPLPLHKITSTGFGNRGRLIVLNWFNRQMGVSWCLGVDYPLKGF